MQRHTTTSRVIGTEPFIRLLPWRWPLTSFH